ncbi:MAG: phosphate/phosphite/phosphonate ABC transporter substrate-binding protein [Candidatus Electrothrix sp. ATG1]|nr:phosphate/phosphite/phosphonate ABC transporter substrate-binding protein [Candidatus Electrothrix sp. ATG1]
MMQKKKVICLGYIFVLLVSLFTGQESVKAQQKPAETLLIGSVPYYSPEKLRKGFAPVIEYLSKALDKKFSFTVTESYDELAEKMEKGAIDIGFLAPVLYVQLKERDPHLKYLVTSQTTQGGKKTAYYFSWLVVRKGSGLTKVKHLRGKSFAFSNKHSSSGYIYPQGYFHSRGIVPDDFFAQVIFAGTHEKVTDMIAQGKIDVGVSYDANIWSAQEKYGRVFRRIRKIGPILNPSFVAGSHVDDALCKEISWALENIPLTVLNKDLIYTGFQRFSKRNFTLVAEFLDAVE